MMCISVFFVVVVASVLMPASSIVNEFNITLPLTPIVIPPDSTTSGACPANAVREEARQNISSSVQMLLESFGMSVPECGDGQWTQVALFDMTDPATQCPQGFRLYEENNVRACGRLATSTGSCNSQILTVGDNGPLEYSKVCGRITGYQFGSPTPFLNSNPPAVIDTWYTDGVSLTYGSPRNHIWTFAASLTDDLPSSSSSVCLCAGGPDHVPDFVGNNYFCEAGYTGIVRLPQDLRLFTDDPLWDGQDCPLTTDNCCEFNSPPWFSVDLDAPTTDDIEVRICGDQGNTNDEDVAIELLELYVQ